VVGVVTDKMTEGWKVDIGAHQIATLSIYAFEGGTKKNRANLSQGSLVYARMSVANKDVEPELSCVAASGKAEGFGPLVDGYMFKCSTGLSRQCLAADSVVLNELGKYLPFEIAVGMNGRIWVNSTSSLNTTVVANAIINSEFLSSDKIVTMVKKLIASSQKKS
jgi:exosome complex component RRP40